MTTDDRDVAVDGEATLRVPALDSLACIHAGPRHVLYRWTAEDGERIVKVGNAERGVAGTSLRREFALLRRLDAPGIVKALGLAPLGDGVAMVMASAGDSSLADRIRRGAFAVPDFLRAAAQLAQAVAHLHRAGLVHRDIQPANIVWDASHGHVSLCDFASASLAQELALEPGPRLTPQSLLYLAPEQTGRTGRGVDSRTDLYALGVTLHEMLVGRPPFAAQDAVALMHAHLTRVPEPTHALRPDIPVMVSTLVSKLLEKAPEQRYQTADALLADLREAQARLSRTGAIASFQLAVGDVPHELRIPERLYGRDADVQALEAAFARVGRGGRELVLITGAPGVGKSALVAQLGRHVALHGALFIAGKFDQLQRSVPFSGLAQAFKGLVRRLLVENETALAAWRDRIEEALGPNGQLLVEIVPELERLVGPQAAPGDVGPVEARNRFHSVVTRFLAVFARREHPLTLFLDDMQWMDPASLALLGQWLGEPSLRHLLLLGAYRDSEVDDAHPLARSVAAWRGEGAEIHEIRLQPLGLAQTTALVSDAFKSNAAQTRALADLVLRKTAGNPFFARRLLLLLHAQGLIRYVASARGWQWDVAQLEGTPIADSVVDLMTQTIERLPAPTRALLQIGACVGHRFDLETVAEVGGLSAADAAQALQAAFDDGLLIRGAAVAVDGGLDAAGPHDAEASSPLFQFVHDRVQQAAYGMSSEARRRELHLAVGRRLLALGGGQAQDPRLFDIVDQLDLGAALIESPIERLRLAELNLAAGRKAQASAAYQAACEYLQAALSLLPDSPWSAQPGLTFAVHEELSKCTYLTGQHQRAEQLIEAALSHAPSRIARADLYSLRVLAATVVGDWAAALRWGREGLAVFGQAWPPGDLAAANEAEANAVMANVGTRRIEHLLDEPEVQDAEIRASMRLLSLLGPPAYFSGADVLTFLVTRAANLSLRHGPSPYSAYAYVFYGALHNARTGEYGVGHAFGTLALALARRFADRAEESRVLEVFSLVVHGWKAPLRQSLPLVREGYRAGVESGELAYAAFNLNSVLINGLPCGVPLADLLADAEAAIDFATRHSNRTSIEIALPFRQFACSMRGDTRSPGSFDDDGFDEAGFLEAARGNGTALGNFWVARLQAAYLAGDLDAARRSAREAEPHLAAGILGMIPSAEHVFYAALTEAAAAGSTHPDAGSAPAARQAMAAHHRRLGEWARHCPENFAHKAALVEAEMARLAGQPPEATVLYRAAIDGAAGQGFLQDEAIAHELRARFFLAEGEPELAQAHLRAARDRYARWGASVKVSALEQARPDAFAAEPRGTPRPLSIDALALIRASQAISAETTPEALLEKILRVLVQVAGASRGAVILGEADALMVRARIETREDGSVTLETTPLDQSTDLPTRIIRYVVRMKEALILADASAAEAFVSDPVVRLRQLRSVLCIPLQQQATLLGVLYLENEALAGAFAPDLAEIVEVLAAQAAISLENARLHHASRQELAQRTEAQRALSEADRRKDVFLAMLAHELRNPLAPIAAAADLLQVTDVDPARARKASAIITRQVRHMTGLVDDLLDVSRVTRGLVNLERTAVDVYQTVIESIEQVRPLLEAKSHELVVQASPAPARVFADPKRLLQVLANLLTNAAKYTPPEGRITVGLSVVDETVQVTVEDTGQGMSPALLAQCFELFVQAERTSERAAGGLGIGLALVRSLVELHGGTVRAQSDGYGQGSRFTVALPRVERPETPEAPAGPASIAPAGAAGRLRILIVDDNEDAADMLALLVEALGHDAMVEHHPLQALRRAERETPDVCLLDIGLPDIDGYELARRLRALFGAAPATLVAVTGYGQPQDRAAAFKAGFDAHFTKPLDGGRLAALLATLQPAR